MLRYLTRAISRAIGFSKVESQGTLILITVLFTALILLNWRIRLLKSSPTSAVVDSTAVQWVLETKRKISLKDKAEAKPEYRSPNRYSPQRAAIKTDKYQPRRPAHKKPGFKPAQPPTPPKDLNKATPSELQEVRGIGPVLSERIAKFRDLLGGFSTEEQIHEVYGLDSLTVNNLLEHFRIQSPPIKLNINSDSLKVLASHPYISYDLARTIINYRKANGDIKNVDDLKKIKALDVETFTRLKPYLE